MRRACFYNRRAVSRTRHRLPAVEASRMHRSGCRLIGLRGRYACIQCAHACRVPAQWAADMSAARAGHHPRHALSPVVPCVSSISVLVNRASTGGGWRDRGPIHDSTRQRRALAQLNPLLPVCLAAYSVASPAPAVLIASVCGARDCEATWLVPASYCCPSMFILRPQPQLW
jgi:hypothetical protein